MRLFGFALLVAASLAVWPVTAGNVLTLGVPSADETPVDGAGNAATDALLDCYDKFHGTEKSDRAIGPPHLSKTQDGYLLRADFARAADAPAGIDRLVCWNGGFMTQKNLQVAPLDPPRTTTLDAATQRAIDGRTMRRGTQARLRATTPQAPPPDAETVRLLEGIWLVGAKPDQGTCLQHAYDERQLEFEFRKSGGRLLVFEPSPYLFSAYQISGVERQGDILRLQGRLRDGGLDKLFKLKILGDGMMEMLPVNDEPVTGERIIVYRCGEPDRSVTAKVSPAQIAMIAPPITGGWVFPEEIPGVTDADLCQGKIPKSVDRLALGSLQFELFGPAHYWVFGYNVRRGKHMLFFDFIRSVTAVDDHTLKLQMEEHVEETGGWDTAASHGPAYELTVIDHGDSIEIPELNKRFARCSAAQSGGMRRL